MASILQLPPEIASAILDLLPGSAIKSLRATCRQLHQAASPLLFPVLYLSCHQLDLDVFRLVTHNPLLASGVCELVIDDTTLAPSLSDWRVYEAVASREELWPDRKKPYPFRDGFFDEPRKEWSSGPDKELWEMFMRVFKGHHDNRLAHADVEALKDALPRMKSLRSLVITNRTADERHSFGAQSEKSSSPIVKMWRRFGTERRERPPFPPRCDWWAAWGSPMPRTMENMFSLDWLDDELQRQIDQSGLPCSDEPIKESCEGVYGEDGFYEECDCEDEEDTPGPYLQYTSVRSIAREARALLVALNVLEDKTMQSQITEFRVDASYDMVDEMYQPGLPIRIFDYWSPLPDRLAGQLGVCSNLTKFHLIISNGYKYWDGQYTMEQGHVGRVLASMPQLEELVLEAHGMSTVGAIPDDLTFKRLRRVKFSCGDVVPEKLKAFLRRHGATLEELWIEHCNIDPDEQEGKWEDVVQDISTLQDEGTTRLARAEFFSVYGFRPFTGCGKNGTIDTGPGKIYSWIYGVDEYLHRMVHLSGREDRGGQRCREKI
ncbi:hypothetical protein ACJ41O_000183 [Fusarium nematophilum]